MLLYYKGSWEMLLHLIEGPSGVASIAVVAYGYLKIWIGGTYICRDFRE